MRAEARLTGLRARLSAESVTAFVAADPINLAYLSGFEGVFDEERAHLALIGEDFAWLLTDSRYFEALTTASRGTPWTVRLASAELISSACDELKRRGIARLALEDTVSRRGYEAFVSAFDGEVVAASGWVETLRVSKETEEIDRIARAQELTDRAFEHLLEQLRPGMTEREIALELEFFMRRQGSEGVAFPPIVASGPNSALPHAKVTDRIIASGDFVKMDFGARIDGYCADMTRTVVIGAASARQREIYDAVHAANLAGIAAVRAGASGRAIDAVAREALTSAGFGELFGHGLGHGVGLEVHEQPGVGPRSEGMVVAGSVITIEPGVYVPGFGGVRIEDLVVVGETGARVLTRSPKDLIEL